MTRQSTYSWMPEATAAVVGEAAAGAPEAAERGAAARWGWRAAALFILGVSLLCWGLIVMAFGALIG